MEKKKTRGNSNFVNKNTVKKSSILEKNDRFRRTSLRNSFNESENKTKTYTSLSMKNKIEMSSKIQEILSPQAKEIEKKLIDTEENENF